MRKTKYIISYLLLICGFIALINWIIQIGKLLEAGKDIRPIKGMFNSPVSVDLKHPLAILLLQILVIIITARIFGFLFKKIGQPAVIGEVIAGIFLGPSFFGRYFPSYTAFIFPATSLQNLQVFSQFGLTLFMFMIGMELDLKALKKKKMADAVIISHASIIVPFSLGMSLAYFLYSEFAPSNISFLFFSLFMGIAMSITAFPVLARILQERGITSTNLATITLTCAAVNDITAWCILAVVIAIIKAESLTSGVLTIIMAAGYVLFMLKVVRPFLKNFGEDNRADKIISFNKVTIVFGILLLSSYLAEVAGIHALFGAFLAGVVMPAQSTFRKAIIEKVEFVSLGLLLPLFFAYSGLRIQLAFLNDGHSWGICGLIFLIAAAGKIGGSMLAARLVGQSWKDSLSIGALMNTRGLMELIVLNIGYDLGILTPKFFVMMVFMALATTLMTGPSLDLINYYSKKSSLKKRFAEPLE